MVEALKERGYRVTPQRLAVIDALVDSRTHPSAEEVHARLVAHYPTMSLATVYKTLTMLKKEGMVLELEFSELPNRYDVARPGPHPHVICTGCGAVIDPHDYDMGDILRSVAEETGFAISSHRLDFYGLCPQCQRGE